MRRLLEGPPLDASAIAMERMRKLVALPVLSADALSSVAYGPEAMLAILVLAGAAGLSYSGPQPWSARRATAPAPRERKRAA